MKLKAEESLLANFSIYNRLPKNWFSIERNTWLDLITLQLAYWHSLRLSKQSALVCSDYSLLIDPKKSRGPDQQQDRGHSAWLGLKKTCRWAVAWFLHVLPCSTKFCRLCCWDNSACECDGSNSWPCGKMDVLCLVHFASFCLPMRLHRLGTWPHSDWWQVKAAKSIAPWADDWTNAKSIAILWRRRTGNGPTWSVHAEYRGRNARKGILFHPISTCFHMFLCTCFLRVAIVWYEHVHKS